MTCYPDAFVRNLENLELLPSAATGWSDLRPHRMTSRWYKAPMSRLFGVWSTKLRSNHCFALFAAAMHAVLLSSAGCVLPDASLREPPPPFAPTPSNGVTFPVSVPPATASTTCGDGRAQVPERCDGMDLAGATCSTVLPGTLGELRCVSCMFDTGLCKTPQPGTVCGNGIKEGDEQCDGADVGGASCLAPSIAQPLCTTTCQLDLSTCLPATPAERYCGNNIREDDEICDGNDLAGVTCEVWMAEATGLPRCSRDCRSFDFLLCLPGQRGPICGNNKREGSEVCDGTDLGGQSCSSLGAGTTGALRCATNCKFDVLLCSSPTRPSSGGTSGGGGSGAR